MPNLNVSVGQACANALAKWLRSSLTPDIVVYERWPEPSVDLFAPVFDDGTPARCSVSVVKIGRRTRSDAWGIWQGQRIATSIGPNGAPVAALELLFGGVQQPMQIDIWATNDIDRDDVVAQLDNVLYAGLADTIGVVDDPVRDGILLSLVDPNWTGYFADYWFDEPELDDDPDAILQSRYRATLFGEGRTAFGQTVTVPTMQQLGIAIQGSALPPGQATTPWTISTLAPNPKPPPPTKVTSTTSNNP